METILTNTENSKRKEPHKIVINLSQRLDFRNWSKHVALQNFLLHVEKYRTTNKYKNIVKNN